MDCDSKNLSGEYPVSSLLLREERSGLVELEFYGYIVYLDSQKNIKTFGQTNGYPFFHRSCAKPLQASLLADYKTKEFFELTDEEIAIFCGSHTGEECHTELLKKTLARGGFSENDLMCPVIEPLNEDVKRKYNVYSPLHNNCSGKHTLMLLLCKQNGWDTKSYLDKNHPLQKKVYEKIKTLCEEDFELPFTLDGCMAPNWATTLEGLARGFQNLFSDEHYSVLKKAMTTNPYMVGGDGRPDTQIMMLNPQLIAKAGAGGLFSVFNTVTNEVLCFKISDANMRARSIVVADALIQMKWLDINSIDKNLLNKFADKTVETETGETVGSYEVCFDLKKAFSIA